jgi:hypothetical protein
MKRSKAALSFEERSRSRNSPELVALLVDALQRLVAILVEGPVSNGCVLARRTTAHATQNSVTRRKARKPRVTRANSFKLR